MSYNSGVIGLVISNRPRATRSADLKLLARLLPESYFIQSNYYYFFQTLAIFFQLGYCIIIYSVHCQKLNLIIFFGKIININCDFFAMFSLLAAENTNFSLISATTWQEKISTFLSIFFIMVFGHQFLVRIVQKSHLFEILKLSIIRQKRYFCAIDFNSMAKK